jgi:H+-transporting ATPase
VGIAVEGATDTAQAAADIVLTAPGLSVMIDAIVIAREIFQRIKNYLVYRVAVTFQLLVFFTLSIFFFEPAHFGFTDADVSGGDLPPFFNLPVLSLVIIVILNDFAIISIAYDHVVASSIPETWTLKVVFSCSVWIGSVAVLAQMIFLSILLNNHDPTGQDGSFLADFTYGQIMMAVWLVLSLLDFFSVFASRIANGLFWQRAPGTPLFVAAVGAMVVSTVLAAAWPFNDFEKGVELESLTALQLLFVWGYVLGMFLVQDTSKYFFYQTLLAYDFEGIKTSADLQAVRAQELLGESVEAKVDVLEVVVKELAAKADAVEGLAAQVAALQLEVASLKKK